MSQENVELTYRAIDAFNRRDLDAYLALMDDDVEAVSRLGAIEATITATVESAAGGTTCLMSFPTGRSKSWKRVILVT